ncbi:E3 ubiquitin-protein ligase RNF13-like isoform X2 [Episyrphus balteatus]|uniref:E3 ubiquitin-protein ligase RNF13-like isoform X2 n=1 Tax=Episyrphus balteatus TaxID=286459 RepID=UPI0024867B0D|nr:E3 ubiquitin-protein ligase RNF13-like isoform X2 [Episyrphus balteatus]
MGFPAYLLGLSLPLIGGVALGLFLANLFNQDVPQQIGGSSNHSRGRPRRRSPIRYNQICPVCQESIESGSSQNLKCGHELHTKCMFDLYQRKLQTCPLCREKIF